MQQIKKAGSNHVDEPRRSLAEQSSKIASSDSPKERQPMRDISNKLHAMVDEFVSNLSTECVTLAHKISTNASKYVPHLSGAHDAPAARSSNRTTTEVLNGLRRPSENPLVDNDHQEGKTHLDHAKLKSKEGNTRNRDKTRLDRRTRDKKHPSECWDGTDTADDMRFVGIGSEYILSRDEPVRGRGKADTSAIGQRRQTIELLSSDQSSDDCLLTSLKYNKYKTPKQRSTSIRASSPRGRPTRAPLRSPSMSRESSHVMNYSYEEDTYSNGGRSQPIEDTFPKLSWPVDEGDDHEGGTPTKSANNSAPGNRETHNQPGSVQCDEAVGMHEGDESNEEDIEGSPLGLETDGEEMPVLPKVPVKRKLSNEGKGSDNRTQRGRTKSASPQMKKQKTPLIDAAVITQLQFGRRPQNCVSIETV